MEKILLYHPDEMEFQKIKRVAGNLKIRCVRIEPAVLTQPIEALVAGNPNPSAAPFSGDMPPESLLLMSDFSDKRMDRLLLALRKAAAQVDFKAVATTTNRKWNVLRLLAELRMEKAAYEANKKNFS